MRNIQCNIFNNVYREIHILHVFLSKIEAVHLLQGDNLQKGNFITISVKLQGQVNVVQQAMHDVIKHQSHNADYSTMQLYNKQYVNGFMN